MDARARYFDIFPQFRLLGWFKCNTFYGKIDYLYSIFKIILSSTFHFHHKFSSEGDNDYRQDAAWYRESETHGAEDVVVYARGPMSHLFHGTHEQTYISHVMMYASCVGPNQKHCTNSWIYPGCVNGASETKVAKGLIVVIAIVAVLRRLF